MRTKSIMLASAALHPAMMTASERAAGRFLRAPDHDAATVVEPPAAAEPEAAPAPEPAPLPIRSDIPASVDDAYDKEFGAVDLDEPSDEGQPSDEAPAEPPEAPAEEPGVPAPEKTADQLRIEELERELAEARRPKEEPTEQPEAVAEDKAPNPDDYEFGKADEKFIEDLARWSARQEHAALQRETSFKAELTAIETGWKGAISKPEIAEQYPDFDEVVTQGAASEKWDCTVPMALLIKNSDVGPHIAYELAKNPAEATRLSKLDNSDLLLEFGRLEGRHQARAEAAATPAPTPAPAPAPARTTAAPAPPTHRSRGSGGQFETEQNALYERMLKEF